MSFPTSSAAFGIKPSSSSIAGSSSTAPFGGGTSSVFGQPSQPQTSTSNVSGFGNESTTAGGFASTSNQANMGGAFGSGGTSTSQPTTNIFGGINTSTNKPTLGGFGNPLQSQTSSANPGFGVGSNVFGNTTNQSNPQSTGTTGTLIFSTPNQQQNQSSNTSNIFGTGGTNQPQGSSSIFGSGTGQQTQPQGSSNIFGSGTGQQNQTQGSNIFGTIGGQQQNQPQTGTNIFGNTRPESGLVGGGGGIPGGGLNQPQTQNQGGLWGSTAGLPTNTSIFGQSSSALGGNQQQQQSVPSFTKTTKFNDLPEHIQKTFENIDSHIQGRIQISKDLKARSLDEEPLKAAEIIRKVHVDLANTLSTLQGDKALVEEIRAKSNQGVHDAVIATRIMDGFKNPQQNGVHLKNHANFPLEFFTRASKEIQEKLQWYKATIEQIERRLVSAQSQAQYNPQAIVATLQVQNTIFIALAGKTAELDAQLQKIKAQYRELWRAYTGSARDPFNELDRRPGDGDGLLNGLGSLNLSRQ